MRKQVIILILSSLLMTLPVQAEYSLDKLKKGATLGLNIAGTSSHSKPTRSRNGYCIGAFINYQSSAKLSYQMELLLSGKGYKTPDQTMYVKYRDSTGQITGEDTISNAELTTMLGYVEVPILVKYSPFSSQVYRPYLLGGGFLALLVQNQMRIKTSGISVDNDIGNSRSADMGLIGGAGIDMKSGRGWFFAEIRYDYSFLKPIQNESGKNRAIGLRAGYWF